MLGWECIQKRQNRLDKNIRKSGGMVGRRKKKKHRHRLSWTNKPGTILDDETYPLRLEFDNRHIDRSDTFRIARSKTYKIPTVSHSNDRSDTRSTSRHVNRTHGQTCGDDKAGIKGRNVWE